MYIEEKKKAISLRKEGRSLSYISKVLAVSKGSVSAWVRSVVVDIEKKNALNERGKMIAIAALAQHAQSRTALAINRALLIRQKAKNEIGRMDIQTLRIVGAALYWAEGYKREYGHSKAKTSHAVSFANTDPQMIMIFLDFLKRVCGVRNEKIRLQILVHAGTDQEKVLCYWMNITNLPKENFTKLYVRKYVERLRQFHILEHGTVQIRVYDTTLFHRIMGWISGLAEIRDIR